MQRPLAACLVLVAASAPAAAGPSLAEMLGVASACSDAALTRASGACESPEKAAAMAVAQCQAKWNAVAETAIGPLPTGASEQAAKARGRSLKVYSVAMETEYVRVAELKVIDLRRDAGTCGFE